MHNTFESRLSTKVTCYLSKMEVAKRTRFCRMLNATLYCSFGWGLSGTCLCEYENTGPRVACNSQKQDIWTNGAHL